MHIVRCSLLVALSACAAPGIGEDPAAEVATAGKADVVSAHDDPSFGEPFILVPGSGQRTGDEVQRPWSARAYREVAFREDQGARLVSAWFQDGREVAWDAIDRGRPACRFHADPAFATGSERWLDWRLFPLDGPTWHTRRIADLGATAFASIQYAHAADGTIRYLYLARSDDWLREIECDGTTHSLADVATAFNDVRNGWRVAFGRPTAEPVGDGDFGGGDFGDDDFREDAIEPDAFADPFDDAPSE